MKKIGILGGTFNPIHFGHLRCAWEILTQLELSQLLFIPSSLPPHREAPSVSSSERAHMVSLAIQGIPYFSVDPLELSRSGPSYSLQTLMELRERFGQDASLYFILGQDAFSKIDTWWQWQRLLDFCHFVVVKRPDPAASFTHSQTVQLLIEQQGTNDPQLLSQLPAGKILFITTTSLAISSTAIRALFETEQRAYFLLPAAVEEYILLKKLYRKT